MDYQKTEAFRGIVRLLKASDSLAKKAAKIRGEKSANAIAQQAMAAALYRATGAWDKLHVPNADDLAGEIRESLARESGANPNTVKRLCDDAGAICRFEGFSHCETAEEFAQAFADEGLTTASAVRALVLPSQGDAVIALSRKVARLSPADRERFNVLLAEADRAEARKALRAAEKAEKAEKAD